MLQLMMAIALSASPMTVYVPPVRSLNPLVETMEEFLRETSVHAGRAIRRLRIGFRRIFMSLHRFL